MSKTKSVIMSAAVAGLLGLVMLGLSRYYPEVYLLTLSVFGVVGFGGSVVLLYKWLRMECREEIKPPETPDGLRRKNAASRRVTSSERQKRGTKPAAQEHVVEGKSAWTLEEIVQETETEDAQAV